MHRRFSSRTRDSRSPRRSTRRAEPARLRLPSQSSTVCLMYACRCDCPFTAVSPYTVLVSAWPTPLRTRPTPHAPHSTPCTVAASIPRQLLPLGVLPNSQRPHPARFACTGAACQGRHIPCAVAILRRGGVSPTSLSASSAARRREPGTLRLGPFLLHGKCLRRGTAHVGGGGQAVTGLRQTPRGPESRRWAQHPSGDPSCRHPPACSR